MDDRWVVSGFVVISVLTVITCNRSIKENFTTDLSMRANLAIT